MKKIFILGILVALFTSCEKTLDLSPKDMVSDATFWNKKEDFELAVNAFYSALPGHPKDNDSDLTFGRGPNTTSNSSAIANASSDTWDDAYEAIRAVNYVLLKGETYTEKGEIERWLGEAYFFRAWHYYTLLRSYGDVPIVTKVLDVNSPELFAARDNRNDVADLIIADLQKAIASLPNKKDIDAKELGRISKFAAASLLSRMTLFEGTRAKFHGASDRVNMLLETCVTASKLVMDSKEYTLFKDFGAQSYRKLFIEAGEDCAEVILSRRYVKDINGTHNTTRQRETNDTNPTKALTDSYLCTDGLPIDKSPKFLGYATMISEFEERDPRLEQTVQKVGVVYKHYSATKEYELPWLDGGQSTLTGYTSFKYWGEDLESWEGRCVYDNIVFRLGEILLNYAEAKFELGGETISDEDLNISINLLRDRVDMPNLTNAFVATEGLNMREEIRRERTVELAIEGFRYNDLIRWKTAENVLSQAIKGIKFKGSEYATEFPGLIAGTAGTPGIHITVDDDGFMLVEAASARTFDASKNYLRWLPMQQIQLNPNLKQNPNW